MRLQILLFALWGFLWAGYFALDGFDFGVGMLSAFLARSSDERRLMINSIGPVWNGNEVWLIAAGAVTFAAFPNAYASIFSSFYSLLGILVAALILRGVVFDFRGELKHRHWARAWDTAFALGSIAPAFLFGLVFGNIFRGLALGSDGFAGSALSFLNPYSLLAGLLFLALFLHHGALWLSAKTSGDLKGRAEAAAGRTWYLLLLVGAAFAVYTGYATTLYGNYVNHPAWLAVPFATVAAVFLNKYFLLVKNDLAAFLSSAAAIVVFVFFALAGLYPNMLPSTSSGANSVTIANAAASTYALVIIAAALIIFMPLVVGYQLWVYGVFKSRLLQEEVIKDEDAY